MRHPDLLLLTSACFIALSLNSAWAGEFEVHASEKIQYKAVFGQVQPREIVPARARTGGTIVVLKVEEGSAVKAGDVVAQIVDDKLELQLQGNGSQIAQIEAQLSNANADLSRAKSLVNSGTAPKTTLETAQTQVNVLTNQLDGARAQGDVIKQQQAEGDVLAPTDGRVLTVPVTKGSVAMPGEQIARIASGGYFLRIALPERYAANLKLGDNVLVGGRGLALQQIGIEQAHTGKLVKIYPEIDSGRVLADVETQSLGDYFAGERTLVWIPVGTKSVISLPPNALVNRAGIDYAKVVTANGGNEVAVIPGEIFNSTDGPRIEVLSGLNDGDKVETP